MDEKGQGAQILGVGLGVVGAFLLVYGFAWAISGTVKGGAIIGGAVCVMLAGFFLRMK